MNDSGPGCYTTFVFLISLLYMIANIVSHFIDNYL